VVNSLRARESIFLPWVFRASKFHVLHRPLTREGIVGRIDQKLVIEGQHDTFPHPHYVRQEVADGRHFAQHQSVGYLEFLPGQDNPSDYAAHRRRGDHGRGRHNYR
jgi:hypothetical protein